MSNWRSLIVNVVEVTDKLPGNIPGVFSIVVLAAIDLGYAMAFHGL